ncbi:MAG: AAA family ATPase [Vulcanisaeta sp.]
MGEASQSMVEYKVFPEEITIENFKSIKSLTLRLKPGINLLVGPNGSGKTNILEAIYFFTKALSRDELIKIPYEPYRPYYWDPQDLFYMRDINNPLGFRVNLRIAWRENDDVYSTRMSIYAKFALTGPRSIEPQYVEINTGESRMEIMEGKVRIYVKAEYSEYLRKLKITPKRFKESDGYLISESRFVRHDIHTELLLTLYPPLSRGGFSTRADHDIIVISSIGEPFINRLPLVLRLSKASADEFKGKAIRTPIPYFYFIFNTLFSNAIYLKHPDIGAISEPVPLRGLERMDIRARNLVSILYSLRANRQQLRNLDWVLRELFPEVSISFKDVAGRVALTMQERGLELPPPNMPDGLIKVLAITTATELEPSILLIDEIENSLHARALEVVFDLLNNLEVPVLIATHSPILVDLAGPERTMIVNRDPNAGTVVEQIDKVESLRGRLKELGVAFSDYVFYGR